MFYFEPTTFVQLGFEQHEGNWPAESADQLAKLRTLYPELSHWGDLALGSAFGSFSQDVLEVNWAEWMFDIRDDMFLDYCCWRQTRGAWRGGFDPDELRHSDEWRRDQEYDTNQSEDLS